MSLVTSIADPVSRRSSLLQLRIWNLAVLVVFVAIAIVDIQDQRPAEPALFALALAGYAALGLILWTGWHLIHRLEARLGSMVAVLVYLVAMGSIYLIATVIYLMAEHAYLAR
jgi:hypothetical protein